MKRERVNILTIIYHLPMTSPVAHGNPMIKTTTKKTSFNPSDAVSRYLIKIPKPTRVYKAQLTIMWRSVAQFFSSTLKF